MRSILLDLYKGVDGFEIERGEKRRVRAAKSSPTYGELMPAATFHLLDALALQRSDVFYDLGCGVGKVVIAAALATPARRCVGIELAADRLSRARGVLSRAVAQRRVARRRVHFRHADIAHADLSDATVLYTCSTAFPPAFTRKIMRRVEALRRPVTLASLQALDANPAFVLADTLAVDTNWRRKTKVHVYHVRPR